MRVSSIRVFGDVTVLIKHTIIIYIPSKNVNFPFIFIQFLYNYNFITLLRLDWDWDYTVLSNHTHYGRKIIKCKVMRSPYIIKNYEPVNLSHTWNVSRQMSPVMGSSLRDKVNDNIFRHFTVRLSKMLTFE